MRSPGIVTASTAWQTGSGILPPGTFGGIELYSILRLRLSLDGEASSPCDNLAARICGQILAEQFNFETLPPALYGETIFAYACGAGGGVRRQSISTFSMLKCSNSKLFARRYCG
jgi:hypothetical protein